MSDRSKRIILLASCTIATGLLCVAVGSQSWIEASITTNIVNKTESKGLWRGCIAPSKVMHKNCAHSVKDPRWFEGCRTLSLLSCIVSAISLILAILANCYKSDIKTCYAGVAQLISAVVMLFIVILFVSNYKDVQSSTDPLAKKYNLKIVKNLGWSFIVACVATALGIAIFLGSCFCKSEERTTNTSIRNNTTNIAFEEFA